MAWNRKPRGWTMTEDAAHLKLRKYKTTWAPCLLDGVENGDQIDAVTFVGDDQVGVTVMRHDEVLADIRPYDPDVDDERKAGRWLVIASNETARPPKNPTWHDRRDCGERWSGCARCRDYEYELVSCSTLDVAKAYCRRFSPPLRRVYRAVHGHNYSPAAKLTPVSQSQR